MVAVRVYGGNLGGYPFAVNDKFKVSKCYEGERWDVLRLLQWCCLSMLSKKIPELTLLTIYFDFDTKLSQ